jgi:hypothetical protein
MEESVGRRCYLGNAGERGRTGSTGIAAEPLVPTIHERSAKVTQCAERCPNVYADGKSR